MITINIEKAKTVAHKLRRDKREALFAPHDRVIQLNIPGNDLIVAEEKRAAIRLLDAKCQTDIDASSTPEQIKEALDNFVAE